MQINMRKVDVDEVNTILAKAGLGALVPKEQGRLEGRGSHTLKPQGKLAELSQSLPLNPALTDHETGITTLIMGHILKNSAMPKSGEDMIEHAWRLITFKPAGRLEDQLTRAQNVLRQNIDQAIDAALQVQEQPRVARRA